MNEYHEYLTDRDQLYLKIRSKLQHRELKTFRYADVPYKKAAVIIPLFFKDQEAHLLFTKRTDKVEYHKGQISFPGGMHESSDEHLEETALRETWEEMGIRSEDLTILGCTDNFLTNTNFMVSPYVAHFHYPYSYVISTDEIAQVLEVPVRHLLDPGIFKLKRWKRDGIIWDVHFYEYNGENIWGVTGFLLSNFLSIIFDIPHINKSIKSGK
jgi:8-oxo-dGTP pyrophosphatase MutT (NUDIX family)